MAVSCFFSVLILHEVSSTAPEYTYRTVRLIQGLDIPHSPEVRVDDVSQAGSGVRKGRFQKAHPGSYAVVEDLGLSVGDEGLSISLYAQPSMVKAGHDQTIVSTLGPNLTQGIAVVLGSDARLRVQIGDGDKIREIPIDYPVVEGQWLKIDLRAHRTSVELTIEPVLHLSQKRGRHYHQTSKLEAPVALPSPGCLTIAATRPEPSSRATNFFNGRVDSVRLSTVGHGPRPVVHLDFALQIPTDDVIDVSGFGRHGVLVNAPSRAVRGHDWDGSETDWTKASYGYGAIHFHEDDLDDARWETDFTIRIPPDARSGAYAAEVTNRDDQRVKDNITFFVRPAPASTAKLALVLSTFTYTAYCNEHMYDTTKSSRLDLFGQKDTRCDEDFQRMSRRDDLGLSLYDVHADGSGTVFSSTKRPMLNVRPGFQHWAFDRPREFSADLLMIGFLERLAIPYDVLTDHDLHANGVGCLTSYSTIITGSHPEYPTVRSLDAYAHFAARGGNIMYLGGNGFYWLSVLDDRSTNQPHRLEVRRGDQGVRTFQLPGGERHHGLNGAQGGLWRSRGRSANALFGIGCCGEGVGPGVPYRRTAVAAKADAKKEARFAWVFEGLGPDELIGEFGFGGGASGDEIDRWDPLHGSPEEAVVLASSTGHSDDFALFPEDYGFQDVKTLGTQTDRVRSDIVLNEIPGGGSVFSVGSMNWYCSLGWDGYKNSVAQVTENVIRRFLNKTQSENN